MVIKSKITNKKYQWIRIPRTATISYSNLFFEEYNLNYPTGHTHYRYNQFARCDKCKDIPELNLEGFSLVRNPINRFISSLYFVAGRKIIGMVPDKMYRLCEICKEYTLIDNIEKHSPLDFIEFYKDENTFYEFFYDNFNKNCEPKTGLDLHKIFDVNNISLISSFFQTQVYWAYHPKVKIFKYEEISKFNNWIEENLGYDTSKLTHINASRKKELSDVINVDFTTDKFKKLVKHLFYDDFRYFNYEFPI
jgi:hypothetical protein